MKTPYCPVNLAEQLAAQFLSIKRTPHIGRSSSAKPRGHRPQISGTGENTKITYTLTPEEVKTLQILQQVSGASLEWLAADAINWSRNYIDELVSDAGQLRDLISDDRGHCPVANKLQTQTFLEHVVPALRASAIEGGVS